MSVRLLYVGQEAHERMTRRSDWLTECSCGRMTPTSGGASAAANAWQKHVRQEADARGVTPQPGKHGNQVKDPVDGRVDCPGCGWTGMRRLPWPNYLGPAGPCPKCGARVFPPMGE